MLERLSTEQRLFSIEIVFDYSLIVGYVNLNVNLGKVIDYHDVFTYLTTVMNPFSRYYLSSFYAVLL